jgi:hypothetical protein
MCFHCFELLIPCAKSLKVKQINEIIPESQFPIPLFSFFFFLLILFYYYIFFLKKELNVNRVWG